MNDFHQGPSNQLVASEAGWIGRSGVVRGHILRWDNDGLFVEVEGSPEPRAAELGVAMDANMLRDAIASRRVVYLVAGSSDRDLAVIVGVRHELPSLSADEPQIGKLDRSANTDARIDGRRITLEATDEIVLRCGPASITLRRNGRVVMRGVQVETRAKGVNRIKGGSVQIN